ncbi:hypothetical protein WR25_09109 [Diploscapter pachys]|uniref:Ribosome biogenesis protein BRX1 homolog n=1 Tax=Diploscapter pachys TaxID=2018661 RepID=A0A2A2LPP6_9BILA|nr:hypothetical protein WR25_09109 [Diploscapter pachys]
MGKFAKLKSKLAAQVEEEEKIEREFEKKITETGYEARFKDDEDDEDLETTSEEDSDNEEEHGGKNGEAKADEKKRAESWTNRERVLILCSRGTDVRTRHLANDLKSLMPHSKGDSKFDRQKTLTVLNEIAEMKNCTKVMYFESRKKKDTYMWLSNVKNGPSMKFLVHNVHTMMELKLSGNCLKASRPILSFNGAFDEKPEFALIKQALVQTLGTPQHHPRSQPFYDHVFMFSLTPDKRIWFRNFQVVDESLQLQEIGPRFVLELIRIFDGSFEGAVLYDNPDYVSPNQKRAELRKMKKSEHLTRVINRKAYNEKTKFLNEAVEQTYEDPIGEVFDTENLPKLEGKAAKIVQKIDKKRKKKVKAGKMNAKKARIDASRE